MIDISFATVLLRTRDVGGMRAFYERVLGFELDERELGDPLYSVGINYAELRAPRRDPGEPELELLDETVHTLPPRASDGRASILAFKVDDIHRAVGELRAMGVEPSTEVLEEGWGWFCFLRDPDGNDLELFQYRVD